MGYTNKPPVPGDYCPDDYWEKRYVHEHSRPDTDPPTSRSVSTSQTPETSSPSADTLKK